MIRQCHIIGHDHFFGTLSISPVHSTLYNLSYIKIRHIKINDWMWKGATQTAVLQCKRDTHKSSLCRLSHCLADGFVIFTLADVLFGQARWMTVQTSGLKPKDFLLEKRMGDVMKKRYGVLVSRTIRVCESNGSVGVCNWRNIFLLCLRYLKKLITATTYKNYSVELR
jgi:hypothetical protein